MDAVYPGAPSALVRGRRVRRAGPAQRHRTTPVTFAEIKEVDEECAEAESSPCEAGARRRPDVLEERLARQFLEFRRRRAHRDHALHERDSPPPPPPAPAGPPPAALARATSDPSALHHAASAPHT